MRESDRYGKGTADRRVEAETVDGAGKSTLTEGVQRRDPILRKAEPGQDRPAGGLAAGLGTLPGGGQPLPQGLAADYGSRLGADLSGVRVHDGAGSAAAAQQLGARAFAVGQDIHMGAGEAASGPLLAHELVHTVQARGSATQPALKTEVSAPGDAAEREADRAADQLVQGSGPVRVAESPSAGVHAKLLGDAGGATLGDKAEKDAASRGHEKGWTELEETVYTNIVATQNQLDELIAAWKDPKKPPVMTEINKQLASAELFIAEADSVSARVTSNTKLKTAMSSCSSVLADVYQNVLLLDPAQSKDAQFYVGLIRKHEQALAGLFGSKPGASSHISTLDKGQDGKLPEVEAMRGSLKLAQAEAQRGFANLVATPDLEKGGSDAARASIVSTTDALLESHLQQVLIIMPRFDKDQIAALGPAVDGVSQQMLLIKRWMDGRTGNAAMEKALIPSMKYLNGIRAYLGLKEFDLVATKDFPEREEMEEKGEDKAMEEAKSNFAQGWVNLHGAMDQGVEDWYALANAKDQEKPSFLKTILTAALGFVVGKVGGMVAEEIVSKFTEAHRATVKGILDAGVEQLKDQAAIAVGLKAADAEPRDDLKSMLAMRGTLLEANRSLHAKVGEDIEAKIKTGELGIASVKNLYTAAGSAQKAAPAKQTVVATTEWVRYVARASLGEKGLTQKGSPTDATNLGNNEYYGTPDKHTEGHGKFDSGAHTEKGKPNREGAAGMVRIEVEGADMGGALRIKKFHVNGLNKEMAEVLAADLAVRTIRDLKLPKEVHFSFQKMHTTFKGPSIKNATMKWVLDEQNNVADARLEGEADGIGDLPNSLSEVLSLAVLGKQAG